MKYWLYFAAKLLQIALVVSALEFVLYACYPPPPAPLPGFPPVKSLFLYDMLFTILLFGTWLVGAGLFFLAVWDQRRRCRTCLHKLVMPIQRGSWGTMVVFGRPQTDYICPFGHGTLNIEDLQITGRLTPDWQPHDENIWKELEALEQAGK
jgi:hypothetical protein